MHEGGVGVVDLRCDADDMRLLREVGGEALAVIANKGRAGNNEAVSETVQNNRWNAEQKGDCNRSAVCSYYVPGFWSLSGLIAKDLDKNVVLYESAGSGAVTGESSRLTFFTPMKECWRT